MRPAPQPRSRALTNWRAGARRRSPRLSRQGRDRRALRRDGIEARSIVVEQPRDIGVRKGDRRFSSPDERDRPAAPCASAGSGRSVARNASAAPSASPSFARASPRANNAAAQSGARSSACSKSSPPRENRHLRRLPWRRRNGARRSGRLTPADRAPLRSKLPAPRRVKIDDDDDQQAGDDALPERIEVQQVRAVVDRRQDEGADQRPVHRPTPPKRLVPPMTEEAIACNSQPSAWPGLPMPIRMASRTPTKAAQKDEMM